MVVQGPATLAESGFVRAVLAPAAHRRGLQPALREQRRRCRCALSAGKAALALSDSPAAEPSRLRSSPPGAWCSTATTCWWAGGGSGRRRQRHPGIAAALRLVAASGAAGRSDFVAGGIGRSELALWQSAGVVKGEQAVPVGERGTTTGRAIPQTSFARRARAAMPRRPATHWSIAAC